MKSKPQQSVRRSAGFVLLVAMIVLVVLATLTTGLAMQLTMAKRRQQFMVEYQRARYGADSAMKYILNELPSKNFLLSDRQDSPDFSDVFNMDEVEFAEFIAEWAETATEEQLESVLREGASLTQPQELSSEEMVSGLLSLFGGDDDDANGFSTGSDMYSEQMEVIELDPNDVVVPGPYGPQWPYAIEPIELEIGPCEITITVEDENAKMPLSWFVTSSKEANKRAENALKTFSEWISWGDITPDELESELVEAMEEVYKEKKFKLNPSPILLRSTSRATTQRPTSRTTSSRTRRTVTRTPTRSTARTTAKTRPAVAHTTDFAKLFHSSLLDQEFLAQPLPDTGERLESPLKYLSLWGAQRVNVNTAPRHVLHAALSLAVDSFDLPEIAHQIIEKRKETPLKKLDELKDLCGFDAETMKQLGNYLTTTSTFFQIRVTSRSGTARSSLVATVVKEGKTTERLMILYEQ